MVFRRMLVVLMLGACGSVVSAFFTTSQARAGKLFVGAIGDNGDVRVELAKRNFFYRVVHRSPDALVLTVRHRANPKGGRFRKVIYVPLTGSVGAKKGNTELRVSQSSYHPLLGVLHRENGKPTELALSLTELISARTHYLDLLKRKKNRTLSAEEVTSDQAVYEMFANHREFGEPTHGPLYGYSVIKLSPWKKQKRTDQSSTGLRLAESAGN